jgi:transcriptional regulator GlxA family with amidase domain
VVVDGTLLTASGVATAADFALELIRQLAGDDVAERVGRETLLLV